MGKKERVGSILNDMCHIDLSDYLHDFGKLQTQFHDFIRIVKDGRFESATTYACLNNIILEVLSSLKPKEQIRNAFDLHVHAKLTRNLKLERHNLDSVIDTAYRKGIAGIAVTEHLDRAMDFIMLMEESHYANHHGLILIPACEVSIAEGKGDITLLAHSIDAIKEIDAAAGQDGYKITQGYAPTFEELVRAARKVEETHGPIVVVGAHIFRKEQMLCSPSGEYEDIYGIDLSKVDAIETTPKDQKYAREALEKQRKIGKPLLFSSDAHCPLQIGCSYTLFEGEPKTPEEVITAIKAGQIKRFDESKLCIQDKRILTFCELYKSAVFAIQEDLE